MTILPAAGDSWLLLSQRRHFATYVLIESGFRPLAVIPRIGEKGANMIKLTRLDGEVFVLNAELIRYVEARPDTFITLTTNERLVVREPLDEVVRRAMDYQRSKYLFPPTSSSHLRTTATTTATN